MPVNKKKPERFYHQKMHKIEDIATPSRKAEQ